MVGTQNFIFLDYLPGYGIRPRAASSLYLSQALNLSVTEESTHVENLWKSSYFAIENCNGVIAGIEAAKNVEIAEDTRNKLLGEAYFLRAYNYFNLVRALWPRAPEDEDHLRPVAGATAPGRPRRRSTK